MECRKKFFETFRGANRCGLRRNDRKNLKKERLLKEKEADPPDRAGELI